MNRTKKYEITIPSSSKELLNIDPQNNFNLKCAATDFATLLGARTIDDYLSEDEKSSRKTRTTWYYLTEKNIDTCAAIGAFGTLSHILVAKRSGGVRPIIKNIDPSAFTKAKENPWNGLLEIELGEYPQYVVDNNLGEKLEREFSANRLRKTGKKYITDSEEWNAFQNPFKPIEHEEFEYQGNKYVRAHCISTIKNVTLSDYTYPIKGKNYWIKVEPITWYVDKKQKQLLSKKCLISGLRFCNINDYDGDFKNTEMYEFLNNYFIKEIEIDTLTTSQNSYSTKPQAKNLFGLDFNQSTEEEIIKGAIESGVPVFLHGRSSEGKSARVKQIDPNCEIIYLRNTTPEGLNGKCVYNQTTGEIIDVKPSWLKKLEKKCMEEPDKNHIVFFDEITNALPSIQGMAFNIVLDREVNGIWHLPENARIVAAGNDMNDSLAANKLAEPLFNRFAHVYIETTTGKWLEWAQKNKIHPAIYAFVAYKGETVLRSKFDGEKPNADPRKWEMASKMLYMTKRPDMIRSLVGEDITNEFIAFCKEDIITLEDILSDNYPFDNLSLNTAEKYASIIGLTNVDIENVEKVRNFVKILGEEFIVIFDALWTNGEDNKLEKLAEIKLAEKNKTK